MSPHYAPRNDDIWSHCERSEAIFTRLSRRYAPRNDDIWGHCERSEAISSKLDALLLAMECEMVKTPAVYLMTNRANGTLYTGVTSDLPQRVWQHKNGITGGFCSKYNLKILVYFEVFEDMYAAISREKQIKAGSRKAKLKLIERMNPDWKDLYPEILS